MVGQATIEAQEMRKQRNNRLNAAERGSCFLSKNDK